MARIREMRADDVDVVAEILFDGWHPADRSETKDGLRQMLLDSLGRFSTFVAEDSDEISGAVCFIPDKILCGGGCLCFLVVRSAKRGRGIGKQLMGFIERKVFQRSNGCFLAVSSSSDSNSGFFEKLGYRKVGEVPHATASGACEWLMRKSAPEKSRPARRGSGLEENVSLLAKS